MAPGARCGAIAAAISANAPTGAHSITQSAPSTARAGVRLHAVGETQFAHPVQRLLRARVHHDLAGEVATLAGDAGDRAADQPDTDQRQPVEQPAQPCCRMNSVSASIDQTATSSAVPTVMRRQCGSP